VGAGAPPFAAALLDALEKLPDIHDRVAAMVRVGERRWNLQLKNGIIVMLPEGQEDAALQRLHDLQISQSLLDRPLVFVDLRLKDRLAVRVKPSAQIVVPEAHPPEAANRRAT
jgi:cell division protein FtsQ